MTREIKYRQPLIDMKSKDFKGFHYWGYDGTTFIAPMTATNYANTGNLSDTFTGLHDKNGKEIHEGDIIRHNRGFKNKPRILNGNVIFSSGTFGLMIPSGFASFVHISFMEVIGNVYENPELLEV